VAAVETCCPHSGHETRAIKFASACFEILVECGRPDLHENSEPLQGLPHGNTCLSGYRHPDEARIKSQAQEKRKKEE
jgi:hypothetical protein